ncbi:uncharacterized protein EI90DRAFT_780959 [Cantharellus anzutake]|uniref:uncharacterized protein n=1 Tax=Cantharellus anzutake TaxID=1750568 RepID=UPI001904673A|nr:uncharacterized protein EI90DRAFT_780959 [Cantharellus anzutake]KAF8342740.1 hypothetical protein EI90DRAFT_780959 [Cantharellus anzutake]
MAWDVILQDWRNRYDDYRVGIKSFNDTFWKNKADELNVDRRDIVNSPTLLELRSRALRLGIKLTNKLWNDNVAEILIETAKLNKRRMNEAAEHTRQTMRMELEKYHNWLIAEATSGHRSTGAGEGSTSLPEYCSDTQIVPPLSEFLSLPVISAFLSKSFSMSTSESCERDFARIKRDLYDKLGTVRRLVDQQIESWVTKTKDRLALILSEDNKTLVKNLRNNTVNALHPADNPTALFACACAKEEPAAVVSEAGGRLSLEAFAPTFGSECVGMDLRAVCAHRCRHKSKTWSIDRFFPDSQATRVMHLALDAAGIEASKPSVKNQLEERRKRLIFECLTCNAGQPIYLSIRDVIQHGRRHPDDLKLVLVTDLDVLSQVIPTFSNANRGTVARLIKGRRDGALKKQADMKKYECKHCSLFLRRKNRMLLSFNGLRSHLKAKHSIQYVRDEDLIVRTWDADNGKAGRNAKKGTSLRAGKLSLETPR